MKARSSLRQYTERRLYKLGFSAPLVRHLLCTQLFIAGAGLALGVGLAAVSFWPLSFGAGASIATYSLWQIARLAQTYLRQQFSMALGIRLFLGFNFRLALIAVLLFALVVQLKAPVVPLLLGLTSTVASIAVWGISNFSRKTVKEA